MQSLSLISSIIIYSF